MSNQIEVHDGVVLDLEGAESLVDALTRWCAAIRGLAAANHESDPQWFSALTRVERDVAALMARYAPAEDQDRAAAPGVSGRDQVPADVDEVAAFLYARDARRGGTGAVPWSKADEDEVHEYHRSADFFLARWDAEVAR